MASIDFALQLRKQLRFLATSCAHYDAGDVDEGVRIAAILRVMFHDTKNSTSLLRHLHATNITLLSACPKTHKRESYYNGLSMMSLTQSFTVHVTCSEEPNQSPEQPTFDKPKAEYVPLFGQSPDACLFGFMRWWNFETVFANKSMGLEVARKDIVLPAADKDGGAHVDADLTPAYAQLIGGGGWFGKGNEGPAIPFKYLHLASLRQVGYEVLNTPDIANLAHAGEGRG